MRYRGWKQFLIFVLPAYILIAVFVVTPILGTIYLSFETKNGLGLGNYIAVIEETSPDKALIYLQGMPRPPPWGAMIHNMVWIAIHLPLSIGLGLVLAYILRGVKGGSIVKSVMFLGMVVPMVVGGLMIRFMFDEFIGVVPRLFALLGVGGILAKNWLIYPQTSLIALILGSVWLWTGFNLTVFSAALESLPSSVIEAAMIDGASSWQIFSRIVVPQLRPAIMIAVIMTVLWDLKIFDIVYVSTFGGPGGSSTVLALVMYLYFARALDYGRSAAVAIILALLTLVPGIWFIREVRKSEKKD